MKNNKFYNNEGFYKWDEKSFEQDRVKKLTRELDKILSNKSGFKILDIASGTGDFIFNISNKYPNNIYYGCDIASDIVEKNKQDKSKIIWSIEDFNTSTDYQNDFFDIIIAGEIIEHLYDTDNFILEIKRILKNEGMLLLTTPNLASWLDRITLLFGMQPFSTEVSNKSRKFGREMFFKLLKLDNNSPSAGHLRCFTKKALKSLFGYYGFEVVKYIPCNVHNFLLNKIITKLIPGMSQNVFFIFKKTNQNNFKSKI